MAEHREKESHHSDGGHDSHQPHGGGGGHDEEEHAGAPEWLISFADNVALMMGFFVILLALTMAKVTASASGNAGSAGGPEGTPSANMLDFAIAVRGAFNNPVDVNNPRIEDLPLARRVLERAAQGYSINEGFVGKEHDVQSPQRGSEPPEPAGMVQFEILSHQLTEASRQRLPAIADYFQGVRLILEIRGHISAEEASRLPDHGMTLSFERALAVAEFLAQHGLPWNRMRLLACGDNDRRLQTAYGREANAVNERVDIIPTDEAVPP